MIAIKAKQYFVGIRTKKDRNDCIAAWFSINWIEAG